MSDYEEGTADIKIRSTPDGITVSLLVVGGDRTDVGVTPEDALGLAAALLMAATAALAQQGTSAAQTLKAFLLRFGATQVSATRVRAKA